MKLTAKQRRFVDEYVKDLNATQAAIRAGYSSKTAESQGCRLLKNVKVAKRLALLLDKSTTKALISLADVIAELKVIMLADIGQYASWTGNKVTMKASGDLTQNAMKAIEYVATTSDKNGKPQLRVKLHSKMKAAELLIRVFEIQEVEARLTAVEKQLELA